jgi:hypothetical protein
MLWIVDGIASYEVSGCNIHKKEDMFQLWIERKSGKTLMLRESTIVDEINLIKEAIDYAIEHGEPALRLKDLA